MSLYWHHGLELDLSTFFFFFFLFFFFFFFFEANVLELYILYCNEGDREQGLEKITDALL